MELGFTKNDLLRYVYKEITKVEKTAIESALSTDWNLNEQYEDIRQAYKELPKATFSPSTQCITNILRYSAQSTVQV